MSTCPPNLVHSFLTVCEIITFKVDKKVFFPTPKGIVEFWRHAQKTTFSSRHGLCNILFLSLGELGICLQNLISIGGVKHWEKNYFSQEGMLKFTYKCHFLTIKKAFKNCCIKNPNGENMLWCILYIWDFFIEKLKSQFLVVFQSFSS
jgi:hypothetical protein